MLSNPKLNPFTFLLPWEVRTPPERNLREVRTLPVYSLRTCLSSSHPAPLYLPVRMPWKFAPCSTVRVREVRTLLVYFPTRMPMKFAPCLCLGCENYLFLKTPEVFNFWAKDRWIVLRKQVKTLLEAN
jgi:hypothetical protein